MERLQITAEKGTRDSRPLFSPPERITEENIGDADRILIETDEQWERRKKAYEIAAHIRISFLYLDNDAHDAWEDRAQAIDMEERARLRDLRKEHSEEEWPEIHRRGYRTKERRDAGKQLAREYLAAVEVKLEGVDLKGRPSEELETAEVIDLIVRMRWHQQAFQVVHRAQVPTVEQFLS